jgi:hypothetical protein
MIHRMTGWAMATAKPRTFICMPRRIDRATSSRQARAQRPPVKRPDAHAAHQRRYVNPTYLRAFTAQQLCQTPRPVEGMRQVQLIDERFQ